MMLKYPDGWVKYISIPFILVDFLFESESLPDMTEKSKSPVKNNLSRLDPDDRRKTAWPRPRPLMT
jgi:hypothetical protein